MKSEHPDQHWSIAGRASKKRNRVKAKKQVTISDIELSKVIQEVPPVCICEDSVGSASSEENYCEWTDSEQDSNSNETGRRYRRGRRRQTYTKRDYAIVRQDGAPLYWFLRTMAKDFGSGRQIHPLAFTARNVRLLLWRFISFKDTLGVLRFRAKTGRCSNYLLKYKNQAISYNESSHGTVSTALKITGGLTFDVIGDRFCRGSNPSKGRKTPASRCKAFVRRVLKDVGVNTSKCQQKSIKDQWLHLITHLEIPKYYMFMFLPTIQVYSNGDNLNSYELYWWADSGCPLDLEKIKNRQAKEMLLRAKMSLYP